MGDGEIVGSDIPLTDSGENGKPADFKTPEVVEPTLIPEHRGKEIVDVDDSQPRTPVPLPAVAPHEPPKPALSGAPAGNGGGGL